MQTSIVGVRINVSRNIVGEVDFIPLSQESLVRVSAYLRVRMLESPGTNPSVCSPELDCVVVASCGQDHLQWQLMQSRVHIIRLVGDRTFY